MCAAPETRARRATSRWCVPKGRKAEMGIFDKAKDALSEHSEQADAGIERAGDFVDDKTGNKYAEHVDKGQDLASDRVREYPAEDQPEQSA